MNMCKHIRISIQGIFLNVEMTTAERVALSLAMQQLKSSALRRAVQRARMALLDGSLHSNTAVSTFVYPTSRSRFNLLATDFFQILAHSVFKM